MGVTSPVVVRSGPNRENTAPARSLLLVYWAATAWDLGFREDLDR